MRQAQVKLCGGAPDQNSRLVPRIVRFPCLLQVGWVLSAMVLCCAVRSLFLSLYGTCLFAGALSGGDQKYFWVRVGQVVW